FAKDLVDDPQLLHLDLGLSAAATGAVASGRIECDALCLGGYALLDPLEDPLRGQASLVSDGEPPDRLEATASAAVIKAMLRCEALLLVDRRLRLAFGHLGEGEFGASSLDLSGVGRSWRG